MLKNYFKVAIRNLARNKNYTIINIAGLSVGIAMCLAIFIIIRFQSSFDNFHSKKDRIYRVLTEYHHSDAANIFYGAGVPFGLPRGLKTSFSQIDQISTVFAMYNSQIAVQNDNDKTQKKFKEEKGVFFTEPAFFNIFDFPLLEGTYSSLRDPNNVLLSKETAEKYFGDWKDAIGKKIVWNS